MALLCKPEPRGLSDNDIDVMGSSTSQKVVQDSRTSGACEQ